MNQKQRDRLGKIVEELEELVEVEEEKYENLPESLQESEKGEELQEDIYCLQEAADLLREVAER